jgi:hypothetical protein
MKERIAINLTICAEDNEAIKSAASRLSARIGGRVTKDAFIERVLAKAAEAERKAKQQESGQ